MSISVTVSNACQGHGKCLIDCPDVFDSDDEGFAVVRVAEIADELGPAVQRCIAGCPEGAISLAPSRKPTRTAIHPA
jgi:ferredoxin